MIGPQVLAVNLGPGKGEAAKRGSRSVFAEELLYVSAAILVLEARTQPGDETGTASTRQNWRLMTAAQAQG